MNRTEREVFHCRFIRLLFAQCAQRRHLSPTGGVYGYIHVCTQYVLLTQRDKPWKIVRTLKWTTFIFPLFSCFYTSGLWLVVTSHLTVFYQNQFKKKKENERERWRRRRRNISSNKLKKTIPNIIPATFQSKSPRTGARARPPGSTRTHTRTMRKLQLSATWLCL